MNPHSNWLGKWEGMNFMSYFNQWDLKPRILKVSMLGSVKFQGHWGCSWKEGRQTAREHTEWNNDLNSAWDTQRDPSWNKETGGYHFPPLPLSLSTGPQAEPVQHQHWLTSLHQALPHTCTPQEMPSHSHLPQTQDSKLPSLEGQPNSCSHCGSQHSMAWG